jgi:hypothetical protein
MLLSHLQHLLLEHPETNGNRQDSINGELQPTNTITNQVL